MANTKNHHIEPQERTNWDQNITDTNTLKGRKINTNSPLTGGGGTLSAADITLGINAASAATANYVIQRDANGKAQVNTPVSGDDAKTITK